MARVSNDYQLCGVIQGGDGALLSLVKFQGVFSQMLTALGTTRTHLLAAAKCRMMGVMIHVPPHMLLRPF